MIHPSMLLRFNTNIYLQKGQNHIFPYDFNNQINNNNQNRNVLFYKETKSKKQKLRLCFEEKQKQKLKNEKKIQLKLKDLWIIINQNKFTKASEET